MDFRRTDDQTAVADLAGRIMMDAVPDDARPALYKADSPFDAALWGLLAEQGLLAASLPESAGGAGLGFGTLCQVLEAQGRAAAPIPLLVSQAMVADALANFASDQVQQEWLPGLAAGQTIATVAMPDNGMGAVNQLTIANGKVSGSHGYVPYAVQAGLMLIFAEGGAGLIEAKNLQIEDEVMMSGEPAGAITLDNVPLVEDLSDQLEALTEFVLQRAFVGMAAMQVGVLDEALKRTAAYTIERKQFGRPLAGFQSVSQQMADAYMAYEALQTVYWKAMAALDAGQSAPAEARAVRYWTSEAGHIASHTALHLHGGIGQDLEYPIQRYFRWAKHLGMMFGAGREYLDDIVGHGPLLSDYIA